MTIVEVDFDRDYFKYVTKKINDFYKDYYTDELLSKANKEQNLYIVKQLITTFLGPIIVTIFSFFSFTFCQNFRDLGSEKNSK